MAVRHLALIGAAIFAAVAAAGCAHGTAAQSTAPASNATRPLEAGNASRGAEVFRANCAVCHAVNATPGGVGPSLLDEKRRKNYDQTIAWVEQPDPPMPKLYPASLSQKDVEDVATYVQSL